MEPSQQKRVSVGHSSSTMATRRGCQSDSSFSPLDWDSRSEKVGVREALCHLHCTNGPNQFRGTLAEPFRPHEGTSYSTTKYSTVDRNTRFRLKRPYQELLNPLAASIPNEMIIRPLNALYLFRGPRLFYEPRYFETHPLHHKLTAADSGRFCLVLYYFRSSPAWDIPKS